MGEAKRRKNLDPTFGKSKFKILSEENPFLVRIGAVAEYDSFQEFRTNTKQAAQLFLNMDKSFARIVDTFLGSKNSIGESTAYIWMFCDSSEIDGIIAGAALVNVSENKADTVSGGNNKTVPPTFFDNLEKMLLKFETEYSS